MNGISAEIVLIGAAMATFSLWPYRSVAAMTLAVFNVAHFAMFETVESDVLFYVSALTFDVACAVSLIKLGTRLSVDMAVLSLCNAVANLVGFVMWFAYLSPAVYNASMTIIMGLQIMRLLWVRPDDMAGDTWFHRWGGVVCGHHLRGVCQGKGETP